jgi:uncharacterized membrane protein
MAGVRFHLGRDCLCKREAPEFGRFTFPLCWRCSGITTGAAVLLTVYALGYLPAATAYWAVVGGLCGLPAAADVGLQVMTPYRSNRSRRLVTGVLMGAGIVLLGHVLVRCFHGLTD